ncbi:MAG: enoyl-CoA hydratase, partial [Burkholderiales bacterium]
GRVLDAIEAHHAGLTHYLVGEGEGVARGRHLAERIAQNARLSNFAVIQALPRIAELSQSNGLFVESLMSAIAQVDEAGKARMRAFLECREDKVRQP